MKLLTIEATKRHVKINNLSKEEGGILSINNPEKQHLEIVELTNILHIKNPEVLLKLENLRTLIIDNVEIITSLDFLSELDVIEELHLRRLPTLTDISWLPKLTSLTTLYIEETSVGDLTPVLRCVNLQKFNGEDVKSIKNPAYMG